MATYNVRLKNNTGDILYPQTQASNILNLSQVIAQELASAGMLKRQIVTELPVADIDSNTIYMMLKVPAGTSGNIYNEYMYIDNAWQLIGDTSVTVQGYVTDQELSDAVSSLAAQINTKASQADLTAMQETVDTLVSGQITYEAVT